MLADLKKYIILHAKTQQIPLSTCKFLLNTITNTQNEDQGSWVYEMKNKANKYLLNKNYLRASQYFNLARFPYIDSTEKYHSHQLCIKTFKAWCIQKKINLETKSIIFDNHSIPYYFFKSKNTTAPLLIVMGGILSIKEQWHNLIKLSRKLGFHLLLTEMPRVGENTSLYNENSYNFFSKLIDLYWADITFEIHLLAFSFSGNLALKAAAFDIRIKSIFTVGAPVNNFFTNIDQLRSIPALTRTTLEHILNCNATELFNKLNQFALPSSQLNHIKIPICYVNSKFDDVISAEESIFLSKNIANFTLIEFHDEHGSPQYLYDTKLAFINFILSNTNQRGVCVKFIKWLTNLLTTRYKKTI